MTTTSPGESVGTRQLDLDPTKLVFIDETGASTNLAALRTLGPCRHAVARFTIRFAA